jgi:hypothetical protein
MSGRGVGKVARRTQDLIDESVPRKLLAIVVGEGVDILPVRVKCGDDGRANF